MYRAHNSDDEDSMEWEHVPENIVDKVNKHILFKYILSSKHDIHL